MEFKEKKDAQISVRMTPIERCLIKSKADAVGMSLSRYMVECAKGTKIKTLTTEEKKRILIWQNFILILLAYQIYSKKVLQFQMKFYWLQKK